MSVPTLFGLCAAALIGLGLYGVLTNPQPLRKILAFNLIGNGVFLLFGAIARRGAAAGFAGDPVPHGLLITGIVVAFSATALAVALLLRLFQVTGTATLSDDQPVKAEADDRNPYQVAERLGVLRQAQDERSQQVKSNANPPLSPFMKGGISPWDSNPSLEKRGRGDF
jgi:multicomponent Na+:H+ antiporter subunit C